MGPNTTLQEAAAKMRGSFGMPPICDGERLLGMLTDRDVTVRATAEGRDPKTTPVRDVMTKKVLLTRFRMTTSPRRPMSWNAARSADW